MTYDDPLVLHTLGQMAATVYANASFSPQQAVIRAAELLRLCEDHLRHAEMLKPEPAELVWPENDDVPEIWARPNGSVEPCPGCGSTTCPGYYKPDGSHHPAF